MQSKIVNPVRFLLAFLWLTGIAAAQDTTATYLLVRSDDLGMSHAANTANAELMATGMAFSTSVMFPTPWFQEAVEILKVNPDISVGLHLTLNSEWANLRWGPVLGQAAVPSLVDSAGYFFPTWATFWADPPDLDEVEQELRAQIERALQTGLPIDYMDAHMGMATSTDSMRAVTEKLAEEYGLGLSGYFGERGLRGFYGAEPEVKLDTLIAALNRIEPGTTNLLVTHLGLNTPEMQALTDRNEGGVAEIGRHREAELRALSSPAFQEALRENNIRLLTYRELISMHGLEAMRRPGS